MTRTNLVISAYGGERRVYDPNYEADRGFYLRLQMQQLRVLNHELTQVTVMDSGGDANYAKALHEFGEIIPNMEIISRVNVGLSYGALNDAFARHRADFDYYILLEDDYFFVEDHFDRTLVEMFRGYRDCGYLCSLRSVGPVHAGICNGIFSGHVLEQIWVKEGALPHHNGLDYSLCEMYGQIDLSSAVIRAGYQLYDIGDRYRVPFSGGSNQKREIKWYYPEQEKLLIVPSIMLELQGLLWEGQK